MKKEHKDCTNSSQRHCKEATLPHIPFTLAMWVGFCLNYHFRILANAIQTNAPVGNWSGLIWFVN